MKSSITVVLLLLAIFSTQASATVADTKESTKSPAAVINDFATAVALSNG